jgi:hypothetical protein
MKNSLRNTIWILCAVVSFCACTSRKMFSTRYYHENEKTLITIEQTYRSLYAQKHFSVSFLDRPFNTISLEISTDSLKYIYEFEISEPRLEDTLRKYGLPVAGFTYLVTQMRSIHCSWMNNLDYYTNNQKRSMVFISIWHMNFHLSLSPLKYYVLTFYTEPQQFDSQGRLYQDRTKKELRKINGDIFRRVNDKVAYTVSERFR